MKEFSDMNSAAPGSYNKKNDPFAKDKRADKYADNGPVELNEYNSQAVPVARGSILGQNNTAGYQYAQDLVSESSTKSESQMWSRIKYMQDLQEKIESKYNNEQSNAKRCFCIICLILFIFILLLGAMGYWNYILYSDSQFNWDAINNLIQSKDSLLYKIDALQGENGRISKRVVDLDNGNQNLVNQVYQLEQGNVELAKSAKKIAADNKQISTDIDKLKSFKIETQLTLMFLSTPNNAKPGAQMAWKNLNPFDLQYNLANKRIPAIDVQYPVKHVKAKDSHGDYYGQVDEQNEKHGIGRTVGISGSIFEGEWSDNKIQGWGREIFYDGGYYEGQFKNGQKNGQGSYYIANSNTVWSGPWRNDQFLGVKPA